MFDPTTRAMLPSDRALRVLLLRHGETAHGQRRLCRGHTDTPLSPTGLAQSQDLAARYLRRYGPPPHLYTSDLTRCTTLAHLLRSDRIESLLDGREGLSPPPHHRSPDSMRSDLPALSDLSTHFMRAEITCPPTLSPPLPTPALREQNMGAWEGRAWEDLSREDPDAVHAFWASYADHAPPNGESVRDLSARVLRWWHHTAAALSALPPDPSGNPTPVTLVTHAGPIRALLCAWLGLPPSESLRFAPPLASLSEVLLSDSGCVIERIGA